jgi:hypothetical protein
LAEGRGACVHPDDCPILNEVVRSFDVVVHNFSPLLIRLFRYFAFPTCYS